MPDWLVHARVGYWLQRCQHEREGRELTENFWQNYDAAMEGKVEQFDDDLRGILRLVDESNKGAEMAENAKKLASVKAPSGKEAMRPKTAAPAKAMPKATPKAEAKPVAKPIAKPVATKTASTKPAPKVAAADKPAKAERKSPGARQQVHGMGVCAFVRAMGKAGVQLEAAMTYLAKQGCNAARGTVNAQLSGGRVGRYGDVPTLEPKLAAVVKALVG